MSQDSGVSTSQVQYQICTNGNYGSKDWSFEERKTACDRFEQMTGVNIEPRDDISTIVFISGTVAALIIGIILGYILHARLVHRKNNKK